MPAWVPRTIVTTPPAIDILDGVPVAPKAHRPVEQQRRLRHVLLLRSTAPSGSAVAFVASKTCRPSFCPSSPPSMAIPVVTRTTTLVGPPVPAGQDRFGLDRLAVGEADGVALLGLAGGATAGVGRLQRRSRREPCCRRLPASWSWRELEALSAVSDRVRDGAPREAELGALLSAAVVVALASRAEGAGGEGDRARPERRLVRLAVTPAVPLAGLPLSVTFA